ncbi:MAG: SHOCT domain-containing protein [Chloroflexota bacterium]|nr:SHOCT domain-containing protein [Chloroflexota bacterium]
MMVILGAVQAVPAHAWVWGWWFPFPLVFWGGLAGLVVYRMKRVNRWQPTAARSARDILAERLARGEIDPDEYEDRLSHLS